ncbi:MAG: stage III sporulation protein AC [Clostridiales bacterium]|nr:stage III sporulation protein AC [Clostridiales bacterium]MCF8021170.1 stage III sporulation protein AC [Clostridiales bacterium]
MDVDIIFKIVGIGILLAVSHTILKSAGKEEIGFWTTTVGIAVALLLVVEMLGELFNQVRSVFKLF